MQPPIKTTTGPMRQLMLDGKPLHEYPLPTRLRAMAQMMHSGAAWGFCGEATWLEEAANKLEATP
jgi:hypothetical protein